MFIFVMNSTSQVNYYFCCILVTTSFPFEVNYSSEHIELWLLYIKFLKVSLAFISHIKFPLSKLNNFCKFKN